MLVPDEDAFQFRVCVCVCGVQSVLTASVPKPKRDPRNPTIPLQLHGYFSGWPKPVSTLQMAGVEGKSPGASCLILEDSAGEQKTVMVWEDGRLIVFSGHVHSVLIVTVLVVMKRFSIHAVVTSGSTIDVLL